MGEYRIRAATTADLATVLYHRRRMFEDMGYADPAGQAAWLSSSVELAP